jgi:branched-chain amino acid transport system substrate-binding protein
VTLLGGAALNHPDLISKGGKVTEGTVLVDGFFLGSPDPEVQRFVAAYRAAHGADPSILEAIAYDSALFVAQILDGGADSRREMRRALRLSTPARTVTNARGFDPQGEMRHEMLTLMVHGGAIVQVWPPPPAEQLAPGGAATEGGAMLPQGR